MAYTLSFSLDLGASKAGLVLKAQLVDTAGANVGAAITTGFVEIGNGSYLWTCAAIPDGHRGGVKFLKNADSSLLAFAAVNPEEAENVNAKTTAAKLAADGLDAIPITAPTGAATTFRQMIVAIWRRFFKRATMTSTEIKTYADDGATVITTQPITDDGTTQTQGSA